MTKSSETRRNRFRRPRSRRARSACAARATEACTRIPVSLYTMRENQPSRIGQELRRPVSGTTHPCRLAGRQSDPSAIRASAPRSLREQSTRQPDGWMARKRRSKRGLAEAAASVQQQRWPAGFVLRPEQRNERADLQLEPIAGGGHLEPAGARLRRAGDQERRSAGRRSEQVKPDGSLANRPTLSTRSCVRGAPSRFATEHARNWSRSGRGRTPRRGPCPAPPRLRTPRRVILSA